ncbi:MAG: Archaellin [Candidatus Alkanophagales archaeon MCA70_species_1]|nr:Archaellin [Candidatus Alkanophaga volatiphilum]
MGGKGSRRRKGFTGLEAAIVLTAFVVVAAVFSYVVLNAGFFTTQKSKEVVHTGVEQATSSIELSGDVIGHGWQCTNGTCSPNTADPNNLTVVEFYLTLTAGRHPISMDDLVISYTDKDTHVGNISRSDNLTMPSWNYTIINGDGDALLEFGEKARIRVVLPDYGVTKNQEFTIEVKPAEGATLAITRTAPASIDKTVSLH